MFFFSAFFHSSINSRFLLQRVLYQVVSAGWYTQITAAAAPLDAAPLAAGSDRAADVGRAGRQRVPSLAVALLAVARLAAGIASPLVSRPACLSRRQRARPASPSRPSAAAPPRLLRLRGLPQHVVSAVLRHAREDVSRSPSRPPPRLAEGLDPSFRDLPRQRGLLVRRPSVDALAPALHQRRRRCPRRRDRDSRPQS